eukprot:TRINITY_DN14712_c0_g3_i2.p4 TRINITY_DN14712_c0_g3~~TRINITY_DN14712_c0_g3_i2.p4  ORF type:complete len:105 (-),score=10.81 TRINITY_DN14712_c0_g3_i2:225-539(-)
MSEAELLKKSKIHTYRRSSSKARMKSSDKVLNAAGGLLAPPKRLASRQRFCLLIHCIEGGIQGRQCSRGLRWCARRIRWTGTCHVSAAVRPEAAQLWARPSLQA